ncbi:hypothetical protein PAXRUDRAFT_805479 [Paxillus rubicundulus Ve08.2h10]|uniref:Uncharacterized protein n=1 Tax=Paxillus rubicundulus Ve08.2h10 TaxID=930991 RepID=A0A0D0E2A0_9AGAM|nr:hypothetical protein PAXRUDRAFT_805479 [Paxillus rubicundulus Ve08.2h10]
MPSQKHKPREKPAQYNQPAKKQKTMCNASATSAQPLVAQSLPMSTLSAHLLYHKTIWLNTFRP